MNTTFLVILTLIMFFQRSLSASSNTVMMASSNVTCIERERESLLTFKRSLTDRLNRLSTWTGVECCEWQGVGCDRRNGHVVKLDLRSPMSFMGEILYTGVTLNRDNWLRGKVSPSLLNLKHLRYLDLSMNNFSGHIPIFLGSFKFLEYLNLSNSGFGGVVPHHLGNLSRLQYLDLSNYNCSVIPYYDDGYSIQYGGPLLVKGDLRWVSLLSSLKHLDLSGTNIGNNTDWFHPVNTLPSLVTLNLASCDINIPSIKFINFTSLNSLDLSSNGINSTIPVWLSNLTGLVHLDLHNNSFHGRIPDSIGTLSSLSFIDLSSNQFNTSMPDLFWNLSSLVHLDISSNKFHGPVPTELKLCSLSFLNLWYNKFEGDLSNFIGNMSSDCLHNSLKYLNLGGSYFNGSIPDKIGEFRKLEYLVLGVYILGIEGRQTWYLKGNQLNGTIPPSLGALSSLRVLNLNGIYLSGPIPPSLGGISSLRWLALKENQLNGTIPESFGKLSRLEILELSDNKLSGNIPISLGQLSNLKLLDVSSNLLDGVLSEIHFKKLNNLIILKLGVCNSLTLNVSPGWIPPFQLKEFHAFYCNIGPHFPNWLQTQSYLWKLDISNSSIRDTIPEWFENISSHIEYLDLSDNQIGGNLPRFHGYSSSNLGSRFLRLSSNKFEGSFTSFPSNVYLLDLSDNLLSGHVPHTDGTMNPDLEFVDLSGNLLTGSVPAHICRVLSIKHLDISHNNFSGVLPDCLGSLTKLQVIDLSNNNLTGGVPSSLGSLSSLRSLHLHNNRFEGDLPASLQGLTGLVMIDLGNNLFTGSIPLWIGENLSVLRFLNLQSNQFTGKLPLQLCQLNTLKLLNLAQNNIIGTIPYCFSNLSGMIVDPDYYYDQYLYPYGSGEMAVEYKENILVSVKGSELLYTRGTLRFLTSLDLSSNNITGEIPEVLMNLVGLENLNLSRNFLKGQIPKTIGNLMKVESLDLSMNKLSGQIPTSLGTLHFISHLNLSFNNLSGPIPTGKQLQTLDNPLSIYEGNIGLCGPPVTRSCKGNDSSYNHVDENEGQDDTEDLWFYVGMGSGFAVGFIGLLGSLHFIRNWRIAYFETLENVYGWLMLSIQLNLARLRRKFF